MLNKLYAAFAAGVIGLYGVSTFRGWEFFNYGRETPQESTARHLSGGHRSFWIAGFRGGK